MSIWIRLRDEFDGAGAFMLANRGIVAILSLALVLMIIAVASVLIVLPVNVHEADPPLHYNSAEVQNNPVCKGHPLNYSVSLSVRRPSVVSIVRSVWSDDLQHTALFDHDMTQSNYPTARDITRTFTVSLDDLPPGRYHLYESTTSAEGGASPEFIELPFQIVNC